MHSYFFLKECNLRIEYYVFIRDVREPEISRRVENTKFFLDRDRYWKISRKNRDSRKSWDLGTLRRLQLYRKVADLEPSFEKFLLLHIFFSLTISHVLFCTRDKFHIDSVSFLVHIFMFSTCASNGVINQ